MNQLLNIDDLVVRSGECKFTAKEIANQPNTWKEVWNKINHYSDTYINFLEKITASTNLNIVLTGAGSSAYIGDVVAGSWFKNLKKPTQAIPTTDLVTHFENRIAINKPLLLISFARSGNSPESKAVIDIANDKCSEVHHLIITCNSKGELAGLKDDDNTTVFLLPSDAEDYSLAMTNSFTSMALAAMLIPKLLSEKNQLGAQVDILSTYAQKITREYAHTCYEIAQLDFNRIVFLGSGPIWGIAKESHLKVQELTNGKIIGKFDSFLGFRHGPKAIISNKTLLVYLMSNNEHTAQYERDLIDQVSQHDINLTTLAVTETNKIDSNIDFCIHMGKSKQLSEEFWGILCVLPAQLVGLYKSLFLGYNPDNPSKNGTISRVVKGVTIYHDSNYKNP